jgi:hypothetical protein
VSKNHLVLKSIAAIIKSEGGWENTTLWFPATWRKWLMPAAFCLWILSVTIGVASPSAAPENVTVRGKVLMLSDALKARGLGLAPDPEPIAKQVVILGEDGTITPLLSDETSRALFMDARLRNRNARIVGRRFTGVPYLQVVTIEVENEGRLRTPEYFCDVCTISVRYPQICPCCQGPMELQMKPDQR